MRRNNSFYYLISISLKARRMGIGRRLIGTLLDSQREVPEMALVSAFFRKNRNFNGSLAITIHAVLSGYILEQRT